MKITRIASDGRITVPVSLRKKYRLSPGRHVRLEIDKDGIRIIPLFTPEEIKANIGFLGKDNKLLKSLLKEKLVEREL